jgi:cytochrome c553
MSFNEDSMKTTSLRLLAATALMLGVSAAAQAQDKATELHNRATAAMCANCHGTDGRTVEGSAIPSMVGMPKDYMVLQLKAFKDGTRPATVMHQITKGLTDAQINTISSYYAATKR